MIQNSGYSAIMLEDNENLNSLRALQGYRYVFEDE